LPAAVLVGVTAGVGVLAVAACEPALVDCGADDSEHPTASNESVKTSAPRLTSPDRT
jgi:hypothetical protein